MYTVNNFANFPSSRRAWVTVLLRRVKRDDKTATTNSYIVMALA